MNALGLKVEHGGVETLLVFDDFPVRIGRDPENECRIEFAFVSRRHARIERHGGRLMLRDEGSRQGTWTRDRRERLPAGQFVDLDAIGREFRIGDVGVRIFQGADEMMGAMPRVEALDAHDLAAVFRTLTAPGRGAGGQPLARPECSYGEGVPRPLEQAHAAMATWLEGLRGHAPGAPEPDEARIVAAARDEWTRVLSSFDPDAIAAGRGDSWNPFRYRLLWQEFVRRYEAAAHERGVASSGSPPRDLGDAGRRGPRDGSAG